MSRFKIQVEIVVDVPDDGAGGMNPVQWADSIAQQYLRMAEGYKSIGAEETSVISITKVDDVA